jgi:hypothetical protein
MRVQTHTHKHTHTHTHTHTTPAHIRPQRKEELKQKMQRAKRTLFMKK